MLGSGDTFSACDQPAPQDTFGSLRAADGNIHLWATLSESSDGDQPS
jgi:hypothetical protein